MKRLVPLVPLLALIAFGAWYWLSLPERYLVPFQQPEVGQPAEKVLSTFREKQAEAPVPVKPLSVSSARSDLPEKRSPDKRVSFHVVEGYAVAFGDVILGRPEDDRVKFGQYDLPEPGTWDKPEIAFHIEKDVPEPGRIQEAVRHLHARTGVRFVPYENQPDAIVFQNAEKHCFSVLGRQGGLQPIRISPRCGWHEITHELMHAMGFIHEQSRPDRDQFIEVLWGNIEDPYKDQFEMLPLEFLGPIRETPFDYQSIMLYEPTVFAKQSGLVTLRSRTPAQIQPSPQGLSEQDALRVKRLFRLD